MCQNGYQWDNKCQQGCGDYNPTNSAHKLVQPLWKIRRFPQKIRARNAAVRENLPGWCVFEEHTVERKATWSKDIHRFSGNSRQPGQQSGRKTEGSEARWSGVDASRRPFGSRHRCKVMAHANAYQWRRRWHPTPVLLPGESYGQRNLVGCSPRGLKESDTTQRLHFHFHALEKEIATHSSVLAWRIPGTAEPGGLPSMGSHRIRHDWSDLAAAATPIRTHSTWY